MAETIFELTGEAREQRIAELKQRMQEAAKKAKAAHAAGEIGRESAAPEAAPVPATEDVPPAASDQAPTATAGASRVTRPWTRSWRATM